jgi:hypothetical protein
VRCAGWLLIELNLCGCGWAVGCVREYNGVYVVVVVEGAMGSLTCFFFLKNKNLSKKFIPSSSNPPSLWN